MAIGIVFMIIACDNFTRHFYFQEKWTKSNDKRQDLRYIDTVFLGRQNHDNQINAKFEKKLCSLY